MSEQSTDAAIDEAADIAGEMGREEILMRLHSRYASKRKRPGLVLIDHCTGEIVWREPQE